MQDRPPPPRPLRICLLGSTGTIGRAAHRALTHRGHTIVSLRRRGHDDGDPASRRVDLFDPDAVARDGFKGEPFDAVISCMASRTGTPEDAWAIDHRAHLNVLEAAQAAGVRQFILLSALCVQKPLLAFQQAKLAFETALIASGLTYSIVRPTAFFKSLSGQIARVRQGRPYLLFRDGRQTACKPIADDDLADYIARCLEDTALQDKILPIGGPGPAITPREQGEAIFALLGRTPRFREVPVALLDTIVAGLSAASIVLPRLAAKAELARIGRYYATESMLVRDPATGRYDPDATPSTGHRTLIDHYRALIDGTEQAERGDHAIF